MPSVGWLTKDNMWLNLITRRSHVKDEILKFSAWSSPKTWHWAKGKKKEIIYDFRNSPELTFLNINCGNGHKFLSTIISVDLSWTPNTSAVTRKTQQRLAPPQRVCWHAVSLHGTGAVLKQRGAGFSRSSTQLRRLSGFHSPPFCLSRPRNILKESSHPGSHLFDPTIKWPLWANTWQQWEGKTPNEQYLRLLEYSV